MRINTNVVLDIKTGKRLVGYSYDCFGLVFFFKASQAETQLANEQAQFYQTMTQNYQTQFANQSAILQSLTAEFQPILQAGPGQYGFSPQEDTSLRTSASDTNATQYKNAQIGLNNELAVQGGDSFLPSGTQAQLRAGLVTAGANQETQTQNQITQAGYEQGRSNFSQAVAALTGNASLYSPVSYSTSATTAGADAFGSLDKVNAENNAWKGMLGGILGGAATSFLNPIAGGLGTAIDMAK